MSDYSILHLEPEEKLILEIRRHWIVYVGHIVAFFVYALVPVVLYMYSVSRLPEVAKIITGYNFHILFFGYIIFLLLLWIGFFFSWTKFFLDVWYVTDSRIIAIEQKTIFHRVVSNLRFDRVQDITVEVNGLLATFLNYGNIRVQTASESESDFFMATVKDPENLKRVIFAQHNTVAEMSNRKPLI